MVYKAKLDDMVPLTNRVTHQILFYFKVATKMTSIKINTVNNFD